MFPCLSHITPLESPTLATIMSVFVTMATSAVVPVKKKNLHDHMCITERRNQFCVCPLIQGTSKEWLSQ